jgi:hypothetical protein
MDNNIVKEKKKRGAPSTKPTRESRCYRVDMNNIRRLDYYKEEIIGEGPKADSVSDIVNSAIESYLDALEVPRDIPRKKDDRDGVEL